jgi:phage FluMu protein Com
MAETVSVDCGFCRKRFRLAPEQFGHEVRCPHCKTIVKMTPCTEATQAAADALRGAVRNERAGVGHGGAGLRAGRRAAPPAPRGIQSKNTAVVLIALTFVGLVGVVVAAIFVLKDAKAPPLGRRAAQHLTVVTPDEAAPGMPTGAKTAGGGAGTQTPAATPAAPGAKPAPGAPPRTVEAIEIKVERLLGGYKEGTVTYAVGRVTNNTDNPVQVLKVYVAVTDAGDNPVGEATAVILNLPPKTTVPLVAEWVHAEGVRGSRWAARSETNPPGVPRDLPPLTAEDILPWPDPNALTMAGVVKCRVTNQGSLPVQTIEAVAILVNADGKIVGAAKNILTKELKPRKGQDVAIHWDHCSKSLVSTAEVWVQPAR